MKKVMIIFIVGLTTLLSGCEYIENYRNTDTSKEWVVLPDLTGYTEDEIIEYLDKLGLDYDFIYYSEFVEGYESQFIMYTGADTGDTINLDEHIFVVVYPRDTRSEITLPNLSNLSKEEIITELSKFENLNYTFKDINTELETLNETFVEYVGYSAGDTFDTKSGLAINLYLYFNESDMYFETIEMEYDGPYLDEAFSEVNYMDPRGGYFEAPLKYCTDGDTAKFNYPDDIYNAIQSSAKSVRFYNMDTEETYPGGEEEWGKPASVYTCELLTAAESIIIQTDPNSGLLDTHGRLLGWIWIQLPGEEEYFLLNYMVVIQGLAQVKYEFGSGETISYGDFTYQEWMHIAEDYAKENDLGQWSNLLDYYWDYDQDKPYTSRWN